MAEVLNVEVRSERGTREARRLRRDGKVPAVLYGHGEKVVSLVVGGEQLTNAVRRHARLVDLRGGVSDSALIRELQWDPFGLEVLHVDFTRVSADERIEVKVSIELKGDAPGTHEGGVLEHLIHDLEIECLATKIPERIIVRVNTLKVGDKISVAELQVPDGVKVLADAEDIVVQCVEAAQEPEPELAAETAEPEVIGKKPEEEGEGEAEEKK
jgi:large subunit ribosomal protein L25